MEHILERLEESATAVIIGMPAARTLFGRPGVDPSGDTDALQLRAVESAASGATYYNYAGAFDVLEARFGVADTEHGTGGLAGGNGVPRTRRLPVTAAAPPG